MRILRQSAHDGAGRGRSAVILLYHVIADVSVDPWRLAVSPDRFEQQMDVVASAFRPRTIAEIADGIKRRSFPPGAVAVTFDDGYANNLTTALPVLRERGVPATVFVTTDYIGGDREFWWDELADLILDAAGVPGRPPLTVTLGSDRLECRLGPAAQVLSRARDWLYRRDAADIQAALTQVRSWAGRSGQSAPRESHRPLTADELLALAGSSVIEVGAHTQTHPRLADLRPARQTQEIDGCIRDLRDATGVAPGAFAYPYGEPGSDYSRATVGLVAATGLELAACTKGDPVTASSSPHELPRFFVADLEGDAFERWLTGCFRPARAPRLRRVARRLGLRRVLRRGREAQSVAPAADA